MPIGGADLQQVLVTANRLVTATKLHVDIHVDCCCNYHIAEGSPLKLVRYDARTAPEHEETGGADRVGENWAVWVFM